MTARLTLGMRHGGLWMADPWYRAAWLLGPQCLGLVLLAWLFAAPQAPPLPSVPGRWMRPTHSAEETAGLKQLRDRAMTDPDALSQLAEKASGGNSLAQFFMATLFDPALHFHPKNPADPHKAVAFYRQAADGGVDVAAVNLGIMLLGEPDFGIPRDFDEARRLFARAAPTTPIGTRELGIMKRNGWGEPMDPAGGMQMIRAAADRGDVGAERIIGFAYDNGDNGYPHDPGQAVAWYQKAAAGGDARAQRLLGTHLKSGDGIAADPAAALDWFRKSAAQGDAAAKAEVDAAGAAEPPHP